MKRSFHANELTKLKFYCMRRWLVIVQCVREMNKLRRERHKEREQLHFQCWRFVRSHAYGCHLCTRAHITSHRTGVCVSHVVRQHILHEDEMWVDIFSNLTKRNFLYLFLNFILLLIGRSSVVVSRFVLLLLLVRLWLHFNKKLHRLRLQTRIHSLHQENKPANQREIDSNKAINSAAATGSLLWCMRACVRERALRLFRVKRCEHDRVILLSNRFVGVYF